MKFRFSAFADESSNTFSGQIDALCRNHYNYLEIRGIDGKNVTELTVTEAKTIAQTLSLHGLSVWSVGSPIGKVSIDADFDVHLELYRHTLELANTLGTKRIRLFSFYMPAGSDPTLYQSRVIDQMAQLGELAVNAGIIPCHENEKGIFGDVASRCLQIHKACPQIKAVFDPANFVQCGQDTLQAWQMLAPFVEYMHIKDALPSGQVVPPGKGCGNVATLIRNYGNQGGRILSLEPHLYDFVGFKNLEQSSDESIVGQLRFTTPEEAFDFAVQNLNQVLEEM